MGSMPWALMTSRARGDFKYSSRRCADPGACDAALIGGDAQFERWVAKVVGFVEAPRLGLDLPLDVRGTAFQRRVWQALRAIPPGETSSRHVRTRRYWLDGGTIQPGKTVGWILSVEERGERIKR